MLSPLKWPNLYMTFCNLSTDLSEYFASLIIFFFWTGNKLVWILGFTIHIGNHIKTFNYLKSLLRNKLTLDRSKNVKGHPLMGKASLRLNMGRTSTCILLQSIRK